MHRSADASVRLFDHRKISASGQGVPIEQFEGHSAAVLCVQVYSIASAVIE
jgi:histone-binding protein RBBP4